MIFKTIIQLDIAHKVQELKDCGLLKLEKEFTHGQVLYSHGNERSWTLVGPLDQEVADYLVQQVYTPETLVSNERIQLIWSTIHPDNGIDTRGVSYHTFKTKFHMVDLPEEEWDEAMRNGRPKEGQEWVCNQPGCGEKTTGRTPTLLEMTNELTSSVLMTGKVFKPENVLSVGFKPVGILKGTDSEVLYQDEKGNTVICGPITQAAVNFLQGLVERET